MSLTERVVGPVTTGHAQQVRLSVAGCEVQRFSEIDEKPPGTKSAGLGDDKDVFARNVRSGRRQTSQDLAVDAQHPDTDARKDAQCRCAAGEKQHVRTMLGDVP